MTDLFVTAVNSAGVARVLPAPLRLRYEADRFVPCDSLECVFPLQWEGEEFREVSVQSGGEPLFSGIVDRQIVEKSEGGRFLRLECRSWAALLVDNEVKPYCYFGLSSEELLARYALPYGVAGAEFPKKVSLPWMQVKKGASCWKVLEDFCLEAYQKEPYLTRDRILTLSGIHEKVHRLTNQNAGQRYQSIIIRRQNDKLLSRIYMKTATETYGYYYGVILDNPAGRGVRRERYYHPAEESRIEAVDETRRLFLKGNRECLSAEVTIAGLYPAQVGDQAVLPDESPLGNWYIGGICCQIGGSGVTTRLTLLKADNL